jgi:hypothetical protein
MRAHQEMVEEDYTFDDLFHALGACTLLEDYPEGSQGNRRASFLGIVRPDGLFTSSVRQSSPC